jgi:hypothetical protein
MIAEWPRVVVLMSFSDANASSQCSHDLDPGYGVTETTVPTDGKLT